MADKNYQSAPISDKGGKRREGVAKLNRLLDCLKTHNRLTQPSAMRSPCVLKEQRHCNRQRQIRTSSSRVVSRTRFCTMCCVALAPTRPPFPGPVTGSSGLLLFFGSILSLSRFLFVPLPGSRSRYIGSACGVMIYGAASASDISSTVIFLGGPLLSSSFAPRCEIRGEYRTHI